jgi:long-chain acyl-CoA synthetase
MGGVISADPVSVIAEGEQPGPFATRRAPGHAKQTDRNPPGSQTMQDLLLRAFKSHGPRPFIGQRKQLGPNKFASEFTFMSYAQAELIAYDLGSGLAEAFGVKPRDFVGVYSENRLEWFHMINAGHLYGYVIVSLYDSFGEAALGGLIKHSKMQTILVSAKNIVKLTQVLETHGKGDLRCVLILGASENLTGFTSLGLNVLQFDQITAIGHAHRKPLPKVEPDWINYICYSSGTTGLPKGVIISNRSMTSNTLAHQIALGEGSEARHLSYLPLPHVFERSAVSAVTMLGARLGVFSGSIPRLMEDAQILRPTFFCAVPRVLGRVYDTVMDTVGSSSALKRGVFWGMWHWKRFWLQRGYNSPMANALVFNAIRAKLGGEIRQFIVGGAAMDPGIHEFLQVAVGVPLRVGYGASELGSGTVIMPFNIHSTKPGTVGGPIGNCELRLEPLEDYPDPECGEVCAGGEMLCSGYLYDDEQTSKLFLNPDRTWARTGDIGKWDSDGYLTIVDRIRSVFKLSQGEYVAAELLTLTYEQAPLVAQLFIYGDSTRDRLVAVVVPVREKVAALLQKPALTYQQFKDACKEKRVCDAIMAELEAITVEKRLPGYEKIRAIACESEPWTTENDLLTPTFKLRRKKLTERYRKTIEELYGE